MGLRHPRSKSQRTPQTTRLCLATGLLALISGCASTPGEGQWRDAAGNEIPPGRIVTRERIDDPAAFARAQTIVVLPFGLGTDEDSGTGFRILESAAIIAAEETAAVLSRQSDLRSARLGSMQDEADLIVVGRLVRYVRPSKTTDVLYGGAQAVHFVGEIHDPNTGAIVAAFAHTQVNRGRKWFDDEERDLKATSRAAGAKIGAAIATWVQNAPRQ